MIRGIAFTLLLASAICGQAAAAEDDTNKKILRDAIQGAITGAVATEATKDEPAAAASAGGAAEKEKASKHAKKNFSKKDKLSRRPPGWDKGKKTGWGDSDVPPGLEKKSKKK